MTYWWQHQDIQIRHGNVINAPYRHPFYRFQKMRMFFRINFFRLLAIPACVVWGVLELLRLQRARLDWRR
jgi:hypothetical protein